MHIDSQAILDDIYHRRGELYRRISCLNVNESQTQQFRGMLAELKRFEKRVEEHFANPEGRNANEHTTG